MIKNGLKKSIIFTGYPPPPHSRKINLIFEPFPNQNQSTKLNILKQIYLTIFIHRGLNKMYQTKSLKPNFYPNVQNWIQFESTEQNVWNQILNQISQTKSIKLNLQNYIHQINFTKQNLEKINQ